VKLRHAVFGLLAMPATLLAQTADQHSQPPPQFTDYRIPMERAALPRAGSFQYVDLALLAAVMLLTAWIVLAKRSRKELRIVSVFSLAYFGFYRLGCICSIGSIQNVTYGATHTDYRLPLPVAGFFVLPLLAALFFGRVFCGGACPMGAMQDLLLMRSIKLPIWLRAPLETLPYIYLGGAVLFAAMGTAFAICEYDPFVAMFRLHGHFLMILFGVGILALSMVVGRPYCRFLCPYGVLLRWCSHFAKHTVAVTPQDCIQCHLCANACPFDAIQAPRQDGADRNRTRRQIGLLVAVGPALILVLAAAGWRLAPLVASWDLRVHRAHVIRQAEMHPTPTKTVIADAWDRERHTPQEAYRIGAEVERQYALATPIFGAWIGIVISLKALSSLRRRLSKDYIADAGSCLSCARCYASCPVPNRTYGLPLLPIVQPADDKDRELVGGKI
jgi:formate hydrogenlyase subunit 6/NADH:ubiquinone oxidoreductase subunit I